MKKTNILKLWKIKCENNNYWARKSPVNNYWARKSKCSLLLSFNSMLQVTGSSLSRHHVVIRMGISSNSRWKRCPKPNSCCASLKPSLHQSKALGCSEIETPLHLHLNLTLNLNYYLAQHLLRALLPYEAPSPENHHLNPGIYILVFWSLNEKWFILKASIQNNDQSTQLSAISSN